jgi:hypothetical protein
VSLIVLATLTVATGRWCISDEQQPEQRPGRCCGVPACISGVVGKWCGEEERLGGGEAFIADLGLMMDPVYATVNKIGDVWVECDIAAGWWHDLEHPEEDLLPLRTRRKVGRVSQTEVVIARASRCSMCRAWSWSKKGGLSSLRSSPRTMPL